jgi:general secretion pathway protein H
VRRAEQAGQAGFTLVEVVAVLVVMALLAGLVTPLLRPGGSAAGVDVWALRIAALLKADRYAALRNGAPVVTLLSAANRTVASGGGHGVLQLPADMAFDALLADRCAGADTRRGVVFFPSGLSCGGAIALARGGHNVEIRINWLTGGVDIVTTAKS